MFIRLVALFLFILISKNSNAEWISIYSDSKEVDYVDTSSIIGKGNIRKITQLRNYKQPQVPRAGLDHLSKFHIYEFDCNQKTFKVLLTVAYELNNGKGKPVFKDDIPTPTYEPFSQNTATASTWLAACK